MMFIMLVPYLILGFIYASAVVLGVTLLFCIVVLKPMQKKGKDGGHMNSKKNRMLKVNRKKTF